MKKFYIVAVMLVLAVTFAANPALCWKEKYDEDFNLGDTGAKVKVGSVVTGGYFFQPPNAVNFVAATEPAREDVATTTSVTTSNFNFREGKCPDAGQTRSVGNGGSTTTTTTTTTVKTAAKAEVKHASSHTGKAPLETIVPAMADLGSSGIYGLSLVKAARALRPDNFYSNTQQTGGGSGPVNVENQPKIDVENQPKVNVDVENQPKFSQQQVQKGNQPKCDDRGNKGHDKGNKSHGCR